MKMTLEQHLELGERVKEFRETLMQSHVLGIGRISSRECRAVRRALKYLDLMKSELDRVACRDFRGYPDATRIYYGMSKKWIERFDVKESATSATAAPLAIGPSN
jgi:hypothetical protein